MHDPHAHHQPPTRSPGDAHAGHAAGHDAAPEAGPDRHAGHSVAMFRDRFLLSLILTIPTLIWGHMLPRILGYTPPAVPGGRWIAPRRRVTDSTSATCRR